MSQELLNKIRMLDFDPDCDTPGHFTAFTKPSRATKILVNTHPCLVDQPPFFACRDCSDRVRGYTFAKCPVCGDVYPGDMVKEVQGPHRSTAPEWG